MTAPEASLHQRTKDENINVVIRLALREYAFQARLIELYDTNTPPMPEVANVFVKFGISTGQFDHDPDLPAIPDNPVPLWQRMPKRMEEEVCRYLTDQVKTVWLHLPLSLAREWLAAYRDLLIAGFGVESPDFIMGDVA